MVKTLVLAFVVLAYAAEREVPPIPKDPHFRNPNGVDSKINPDCPVCETEECISTAARILQSLNPNIDPCEDFYQYACSGWINHQILPPHRSSLNSADDVDVHVATARTMLAEEPKDSDLNSVKKAKRLYKSCVQHATQTDGDDSIVEVINGLFGFWPLTVVEWNDAGFDLGNFLITAIRLGVHPLIRLEVGVKENLIEGRTTYSHVLRIKQPEFGLPTATYWDTSEDDLNLKIYRSKIYADAERFGIEDSDTAKEDVKAIVEVERMLAEMLPRVEDDSETNYTLGELQETYGALFNWTRLLTTIASAWNIGITDITPDEVVVLEIDDYLVNMTTYFSSLPDRTQANYIIWRVLDSLENVLVQKHNKVDFVLNRAIYGITGQPSPEESCVTYVSKVFKLVLHRLLYTSKFPPEERKIVYDMIKRIQNEFNEVVDEHNWVDEFSARIIKEKNDALATKLMYVEQSMDDSFLENYYINVTVKKNNFRENVLKERFEAFARNLRLLRKPYEDTIEQLPYEAVAQNNFDAHRMEFTSTTFEPPSFTSGVPHSLNYGGMGMVFGHELIHSFDDSGYKYSKEGIEGDWWSSETVSNFQQRHQCMINQYNHFFYTKAGQFVNGTLTLGENIADNGGLKLSYRAYRKYAESFKKRELSLPGLTFSDEKLFFVNFAQSWCTIQNKETATAYMADTHSPPEFRVRGTIQNSKEFASVFNCPVGSPMNPETKCEVW